MNLKEQQIWISVFKSGGKALLNRNNNVVDLLVDSPFDTSMIIESNEKTAQYSSFAIQQNIDMLLELCALSGDVYNDDKIRVDTKGFRPYNFYCDGNRFCQLSFSDKAGTGFISQLYCRQKGNFIEYVWALKGSDCAKDYLEDASQIYGDVAQYDKAVAVGVELFNILKEDIAEGRASLIFTGHSLGGGMATLCTLCTGIPSIVYNPAAISATTIQKYCHLIKVPTYYQRELITSVIMANDFANIAQDFLSGQNIGGADVIRARGSRLYLESNVSSVFSAHSIKTVYDTLKNYAAKKALLKENGLWDDESETRSNAFSNLKERIRFVVLCNFESLAADIVKAFTYNYSSEILKDVLTASCNHTSSAIRWQISSYIYDIYGRLFHFDNDTLFEINIDKFVEFATMNPNDYAKKFRNICMGIGGGLLFGPWGAVMGGGAAIVKEALNKTPNKDQVMRYYLSLEIEKAIGESIQSLNAKTVKVSNWESKSELLQDEQSKLNQSKIIVEQLKAEIALYRRHMFRLIESANLQTWWDVKQESLGTDQKGNITFSLVEDTISKLYADAANDIQVLFETDLNAHAIYEENAKKTLSKLGSTALELSAYPVSKKVIGALLPWWRKVFSNTVVKYAGSISIGIQVVTTAYQENRENQETEAKMNEEKERVKVFLDKYFDELSQNLMS